MCGNIPQLVNDRMVHLIKVDHLKRPTRDSSSHGYKYKGFAKAVQNTHILKRTTMQPQPVRSTWAPPEHWNSLFKAVWSGDIDHLQRLLSDPRTLLQLDNGPGIDDERSPLYHAVQYHNAEMVKLLLVARADPHKQISRGARRSDRPWIETTPYRAARGRIKEVFDQMIWRNSPPPPPPPAMTPILTSCGWMWL